jgi:glycosyltransferase involved in cell wall biosynthesis
MLESAADQSDRLLLHIISGLDTGGAETMLSRLVTRIPAFRHRVVSLRSLGELGPGIIAAGTPVTALGMGSSPTGLASITRLPALVARMRPDLIQGWMTHGNVAGLLGALGHRRAPVIWNVRQSIDMRFEKPATRLLLKGSARLARFADAIIYNSHMAADHHEQLGYPARLRRIIPNGFDTDCWRPDELARERLRSSLGVAPEEVLVGLVARFHPWKNHRGFLAAASQIPRALRMRVALVGAETDSPEAMRMVEEMGLSDRVICLGRRTDMLALNQSFDIAVNLSHGEGFPNVVGEAMSCGVPCLMSDISDAKLIIGDAGEIVPRDDTGAVVRGLRHLVEMDPAARRTLGLRARKHIGRDFSIASIAKRYEQLYESHLAGLQA